MLEDPDEEPNQGPVIKLLKLGLAMLYSNVNLYNEVCNKIIITAGFVLEYVHLLVHSNNLDT